MSPPAPLRLNLHLAPSRGAASQTRWNHVKIKKENTFSHGAETHPSLLIFLHFPQNAADGFSTREEPE